MTGCGAAAQAPVTKPAPGAVPAAVPVTSLTVGPAPSTAAGSVADLDRGLNELNSQLSQLDTDLAAAGGS